MSVVSDAIAAAYQSLAVTIKSQTAAWEAAGCPPTFSVDGESYDWNNWLTAKVAALSELRKEMTAAQGPFVVRSYGRA